MVNDNGKRASLVDYEIVTQCGSGTYGSVYRAIHKVSRKVVALKKVIKFPVEDGFPVECKYLEQLVTSKNIINLLEFFYTNDGQLVLVFEYMETDLWKLISGPNANVPLLQTKCIMKQLFEGLCQCHDAGIMHRDVKPSNLLINSNGILKLADFGLTTTFVKPPYLSNNVVSLYYRPPELLLGSHSYGPEIDMWSAGCILVELLTNNYLFAGTNETEQLDLIFRVFGTPDEHVWPGVSQLPGWGLVESGKQHPLRDLEDNYKFLESNVLDLASRLLNLDPAKRITSFEALNHPWFSASPLPCAPSSLPSLWKNNPKVKRASYTSKPQPNRFQEPPNANIWGRKENDYNPQNYEGSYFPQQNNAANNYYNYNNMNMQMNMNMMNMNMMNNMGMNNGNFQFNNFNGYNNNPNGCADGSGYNNYNYANNNYTNGNYNNNYNMSFYVNNEFAQPQFNPYFNGNYFVNNEFCPPYGIGPNMVGPNNYNYNSFINEYATFNQNGYHPYNENVGDGKMHPSARKDAWYGDMRRNAPRYTHSQL